MTSPLSLPDTIRTPRLLLRAPVAADADALFAGYTQDAEVARYMVWTPHADLGATQRFVAWCIAQWLGEGARPYVLVPAEGGAPIGMLDLRRAGHVVNIGYVLARSHWGRGLMPEAVAEAVSAVRADPTVFRVEATCDADNRASARTLEKSGFVREGLLRRWTVHPNIAAEPRDCWMYAACR